MTLTLQEVFDINWKHFVVNRQPPAWNHIKKCCEYRTPNGRKCAIGVCLPDDILAEVIQYQNNTGGVSCLVGDLIDSIPSVERLFEGIEQSVLYELQSIHDSLSGTLINNFSSQIETKLREYGKRHNLAIPEPTIA